MANQTKFTLLRKLLSEYLHEFNYDDFRLVKEECCADEGNTYWVCSDKCFELGSILTGENGLFEAYSPEERYSCCKNIINLSYKSETYFFTSFFFQFVAYVNFIFTELFACYIDFYFIVRSFTIERNYPVKGRKCFYQDLALLHLGF